MSPDVITQPAEGIFRIAIPVPLPLKYLYSYVISMDSQYLILDLGMDTPEARQTWMNVSKHLGLAPGRVSSVFITHFHPDHVGLAQFAADLWDAPLFMWGQEIDTVYQIFGNSSRNLVPFLEFHGMPHDLATYVDQEQFFTKSVVRLPAQPPIQPLDPLTTWGPLQLLDQPGHTDHQLLLYWPERELLFTGDQILARITPNISLWPNTDPDPLASYLQSLRYLHQLPVKMGLPAHEAIIPDVPGRITEIIHHHDDRAQRILDLINEPHTAFEVAQKLFTRPLTQFQWRFAVSETLAHLEYLRRRQLVTFRETNHKGFYQTLRDDLAESPEGGTALG